jgi:signal transduction histidine kinase
LLCYALLSNLVKNALEACLPEETVTITLSDAGDLQRIEIHNPTPVPEAVRDRFFEKYATFGKNGGMGLGAYSARLMAETLGGLVSMRTSESEGCTVTIALLPS